MKIPPFIQQRRDENCDISFTSADHKKESDQEQQIAGENRASFRQSLQQEPEEVEVVEVKEDSLRSNRRRNQAQIKEKDLIDEVHKEAKVAMEEGFQVQVDQFQLSQKSRSPAAIPQIDIEQSEKDQNEIFEIQKIENMDPIDFELTVKDNNSVLRRDSMRSRSNFNERSEKRDEEGARVEEEKGGHELKQRKK